MDIEMKFTATLSEEDVVSLVKQVFNKQGYDVDEVIFNLGKRHVGMQHNGYEQHYFKNIEVKIRQGDRKKPIVIHAKRIDELTHKWRMDIISLDI